MGERPDGGARLDALLAAAMRPKALDAEAEARAVAAFRVAREQGTRAARIRRRDDWRPKGERRAGRSLRTALAVAAAALTLGGAAMAAVGRVPGDAPEGRTHPSSAAPATSSAAPGVRPTGGQRVDEKSNRDNRGDKGKKSKKSKKSKKIKTGKSSPKPVKSTKSNKPKKVEKVEKVEKAEKAEKVAKGAKVDKAEKVVKAEVSAKAEKATTSK
ncbi:hypothetical protein AB0D71_15330 [Streptomyces avermitilis]|uniref:hypothetical protein n=1 Tax=Streptomyces avermitilis TaxID=33903 RepID=UPI0033D50456